MIAANRIHTSRAFEASADSTAQSDRLRYGGALQTYG
jgi:hypothetical protein